MTAKIANRNASAYIYRREEFKGSNLFGRVVQGGAYVVFSYGTHFPMFAFVNGQWYRNTDKYSPTTSKQQTMTAPRGVSFVDMSTAELRKFLGL